MWQIALAALAFAVAVLGSACQGASRGATVPPAATGVQAFVSVLRSDNPAPAYALLSTSAKAQMSFEDFAAQWKASAAERAYQAQAIEEGLKGKGNLSERAKVALADGKSAYLVRQSARWRLESAMIARVHASQPHDAVRLFASSLAKQDYDAVLRILTSRRRDGISAQLSSFVTSLSAHLQSADNAIETIGTDRAEMRWDDGERRYRIVLRKENGEWRIDDVHILPAKPSEPE